MEEGLTKIPQILSVDFVFSLLAGLRRYIAIEAHHIFDEHCVFIFGFCAQRSSDCSLLVRPSKLLLYYNIRLSSIRTALSQRRYYNCVL